MNGLDAAGISRNGIRVDPAKQREWQRRGAVKYAAKRRTLGRSDAKLTAKVAHTRNDWPPRVRKLAAKRSGGVCEIDGQRPAVHLHHRKLRRHRDHRICNALHVCERCHDAIHDGKNIPTSRILGWLVHSNGDPAKIAVMIAGPERVLLTDTGHYEQAAA